MVARISVGPVAPEGGTGAEGGSGAAYIAIQIWAGRKELAPRPHGCESESGWIFIDVGPARDDSQLVGLGQTRVRSRLEHTMPTGLAFSASL